MNNTLTGILTLILRFALTWLLGAMAAHVSKPVWTLVNDIITYVGGPEVLITAIVGTLGVFLVAVWAKLKSKLDLKNALAAPRGASLDEVRAVSATQNPLTTITDPAK